MRSRAPSCAGGDHRPAHRARQADAVGIGLAYETPRGEELSERLASVLEVVYLIFNEGYTAARGEDWLRPQLCNEALRMGRVLTSIAPHEPEAHGLLALMELNASRIAARTDAAGEPILLMEQNRALWDQLQIRRGMMALARAARTRRRRRLLRAAGGDHRLPCAGGTADDTDWPAYAELYAQLAAMVRSPVIELNRAVAVGMAEGPAAALAIVDTLRRARAENLSFARQRPRRPLAQARPLRGSARRVRGGGGPRGQPARTGIS